MERHSIISSDCQAGLPKDQYRAYVDLQYRDMFDMALPIQTEMTDKAEKIFLFKEVNDAWRKDIQEHLTGT